MHAVAVTPILLWFMPWGQVADYSGSFAPGESNEAPRYVVTESSQTRATRAVNPVYGNYPAESVAAAPRYAQDNTGHVLPVNHAQQPEDPQSSLGIKLLREMLPATSQDPNQRPLHLVDALERVSGAQQQYEAIKAYWKWNLAMAEFHGVAEEQALLARVGAPRTQHEQAAHQAARHAAEARLEDTRLEVVMRMFELQSVTGLSNRVSYFPVDIPLTSAYNTNYQRMFPNGGGPAELRKIHTFLPYILKVVRTRSDALAAARLAMAAAESAYSQGQMPHAALLEAVATFRSQRRAFLDSVHDYNFNIAEYALSATGSGMRRETVVSMLIHSPYATQPRTQTSGFESGGAVRR